MYPWTKKKGKRDKKTPATTYSRTSSTSTTIGNAAFDGRVRDGIGSGHCFRVTGINWVLGKSSYELFPLFFEIHALRIRKDLEHILNHILLKKEPKIVSDLYPS